MAKTLDQLGIANPKILETIRRCVAGGMSNERIGQEIFAKHGISVSRTAVKSWLADNPPPLPEDEDPF